MDFADRLGGIDKKTANYEKAIAESASHRTGASRQIQELLDQTVEFLVHRQVRPRPIVLPSQSAGSTNPAYGLADQRGWGASGFQWALTEKAQLIRATHMQVPSGIDVQRSPLRKSGLRGGDWYLKVWEGAFLLSQAPAHIAAVPNVAVTRMEPLEKLGSSSSYLWIEPPLSKEDQYGVLQNGRALIIGYSDQYDENEYWRYTPLDNYLVGLAERNVAEPP